MSRCPSKTGDRSHAATTTMASDAGKTGPWSAQRDEELMLEYIGTGSQSAFEELVRRFEREIYSYLRNYLGDAHLAEDAFQATFLQLHLKCHQFEPDRRLRPWLYTIASNQAIDLLRRNRRHRAVSLSATAGCSAASDERQSLGGLLETTDAGPSERLESAEDCQKTRSAVKNISAKLRLVTGPGRVPGTQVSRGCPCIGNPPRHGQEPNEQGVTAPTQGIIVAEYALLPTRFQPPSCSARRDVAGVNEN